MALNIKNKETENLARELSKLTGESLTFAVTKALRERLERVRNERGIGLADRLMEIGRKCAANLREPSRSEDHGNMLFDEKGLPR